MSKVIEGRFGGRSFKVALVVSRFNDTITGRLKEAAEDTLRRHGIKEDDIHVIWVPGAFEIPLVAQVVARKPEYQAVLCLGAVIRGQTPHFDYVAGQSAGGVAQAALATGKPVIYGILTTDTVEQAMDRAGLKSGNKGHEAAMAALEMVSLLEQLGA